MKYLKQLVIIVAIPCLCANANGQVTQGDDYRWEIGTDLFALFNQKSFFTPSIFIRNKLSDHKAIRFRVGANFGYLDNSSYLDKDFLSDRALNSEMLLLRKRSSTTVSTCITEKRKI